MEQMDFDSFMSRGEHKDSSEDKENLKDLQQQRRLREELEHQLEEEEMYRRHELERCLEEEQAYQREELERHLEQDQRHRKKQEPEYQEKMRYHEDTHRRRDSSRYYDNLQMPGSRYNRGYNDSWGSRRDRRYYDGRPDNRFGFRGRYSRDPNYGRRFNQNYGGDSGYGRRLSDDKDNAPLVFKLGIGVLLLLAALFLGRGSPGFAAIAILFLVITFIGGMKSKK